MSKPLEKGAPDWERIEINFRAGVLSLREIAGADGNVTEGAIRKRAKKLGWERDLAGKIQAKAEAMVRRDAVRNAGTQNGVTQLDQPTEAAIVDANALAITRVRLSHRVDIGRSRKLAMRLLEELEQQTDHADDLAELGELLKKPDDRGIDKLNELYQKVISLPARTKTMKDLADTLKTLVALEREAYNIVDGGEKPKDAESLTDSELDDLIKEGFERFSQG